MTGTEMAGIHGKPEESNGDFEKNKEVSARDVRGPEGEDIIGKLFLV